MCPSAAYPVQLPVPPKRDVCKQSSGGLSKDVRLLWHMSQILGCCARYRDIK